tara:strand:- start:714 stop:1511 length:798 start_codon:yes stop_codon:yes gene_type:complete
LTKIIKAPLQGTGLTEVVTVGCVHLGKENKAFTDIFYDYVAEKTPHIIVSGGDLTDAGQFRGSARNGEGGKISPAELTRAIEKDFRYTRDFVYKTAPVCENLYMIRGNHELRYERIADTQELFKDTLSYDTYCQQWAPEATHVRDWGGGQELRIGKARFIHGRYYGTGHLKQHFDRYGEHTYYWHTHEYAVGSFHKNMSFNAPQVATLGCGEKLLPDWMLGSPHKWVNCFQHWYFEPNGNFQMYNIMVNGNKAIMPNGEVWTGKG